MGDDEGVYMARQQRQPLLPQAPLEDTPAADAGLHFGSAHSSLFHMAMCDGSVRGSVSSSPCRFSRVGQPR